ncbi:ABC transporter permease [Leucobacter weissii]|uniref:ABC transporter permease n=1 Tax=Leucobacter weissii TaxID=1983706 RepID=A0A939MI82_9MICO|nr:ABC transporter permease [Leucobacter weissii]MBO1901066.1 ABC transporter permease [Leucobacter weissii]
MIAPNEETMSTAVIGSAELYQRPPVWKRVLGSDAFRLFLAMVALIAVFGLLRPSAFFTPNNFINLLTDAAILLVMAAGATYVIITAGIDLSVGGVLVFSSVTGALTMAAIGDGSPLTLVIGLLVSLASGAAWGVLNGLLVAKARIPALIVTLATMGASLGASLLITGGVDVRNVPFELVDTVGSGRILGIPVLAVIAIAVAVVFGLILAQTRFGRYTYAVGSNAEALRRTGVNVDRHLVKVYMLAGLLAGLAGYLSVARFATTTLGGHSTDNLSVITAVVIGGASLFGGRGLMIGTVIGVFIPVILQNGFVILNISPYWQQIAVGAVLLGAVYLDQMRRRNSNR